MKDLLKNKMYLAACQKSGSKPSEQAYYLHVIKWCQDNGISSVLDIGIGPGTQAYLFQAAGIRYLGIEQHIHNKRCCFDEAYRSVDGNIEIVVGEFPHTRLPWKPEAAIALFSIGSREFCKEDIILQLNAACRYENLIINTFDEVMTMARVRYQDSKFLYDGGDVNGTYVMSCPIPFWKAVLTALRQIFVE